MVAVISSLQFLCISLLKSPFYLVPTKFNYIGNQYNDLVHNTPRRESSAVWKGWWSPPHPQGISTAAAAASHIYHKTAHESCFMFLFGSLELKQQRIIFGSTCALLPIRGVSRQLNFAVSTGLKCICCTHFDRFKALKRSESEGDNCIRENLMGA